jgi:hypothetical protein
MAAIQNNRTNLLWVRVPKADFTGPLNQASIPQETILLYVKDEDIPRAD